MDTRRGANIFYRLLRPNTTSTTTTTTTAFTATAAVLQKARYIPLSPKVPMLVHWEDN